MRKARVAGVAICFALLAATAEAGESDQVDQAFSHSFDASAMRTSDGVDREYSRLKKAVKGFCRMNGNWHPVVRRAEKECRADVFAAAAEKMPGEMLAVHLARADR